MGMFLLYPPPPGVTSETDVTIHSRAQLLQNTRKNVVFTLLFAASAPGKWSLNSTALAEMTETNLSVKIGNHKKEKTKISELIQIFQ